jgi:hypothetical protein
MAAHAIASEASELGCSQLQCVVRGVCALAAAAPSTAAKFILIDQGET